MTHSYLIMVGPAWVEEQSVIVALRAGVGRENIQASFGTHGGDHGMAHGRLGVGREGRVSTQKRVSEGHCQLCGSKGQAQGGSRTWCHAKARRSCAAVFVGAA